MLTTRALRARVVTTFIGSDGTRARSLRTVTIPRRIAPRASAGQAVTG